MLQASPHFHLNVPVHPSPLLCAAVRLAEAHRAEGLDVLGIPGPIEAPIAQLGKKAALWQDLGEAWIHR